MDRQDTLHAALQLQRDAGLMSSNMTVLHQYAIALHRMSTEVPDSVFGREFLRFGSGGRHCAGALRVSGVDSDGGYGP